MRENFDEPGINDKPMSIFKESEKKIKSKTVDISTCIEWALEGLYANNEDKQKYLELVLKSLAMNNYETILFAANLTNGPWEKPNE